MARGKTLISVIVVLGMTFSLASAHSGRTDSQGGHKDNKNASGLGSYHFHHGMGPHLHPNGICPYAPKDTISIDNQPSSLIVGESLALSWTVTYYSGSSSVSWSSSDSSVLSAEGGTLVAKAAGTATVTATLNNGSKSFKVKVKTVPVTSVTVVNPLESLGVNRTYQAYVNVLPNNATFPAVTWESSDQSVATVSQSGAITATSPGTTVITAKTNDGKSHKFNLEVFEVLPERIDIALPSEALPFGAKDTISVNLYPSDTTNKGIQWSSSNTGVITVDQTGTYHCIGEGQAIITAQCQHIIKEVAVNVYLIRAKSIRFDSESIPPRMELGAETTPVVIFEPQDTTLQAVTLSSSDQEVIEVIGNQLVAKNAGKATITATSADGETTMEISVYDPSRYAAIGGVAVLGGGAAAIWVFRKRRGAKR